MKYLLDLILVKKDEKMKFIKKYTKFKESLVIDLELQDVKDLMESLSVWHDALLSSIRAEEFDIFSTFHLPKEEFSDRMDLDELSENVEFINSLSSIGLKKSELQKSESFSTFLNKPCKFMFVYEINSNELENPQYLLFQSWIDSLDKWEDIKLYKVNDDAQKFYDKLASKVIELVDGDENYIYNTSNSNEWVIQNIEKANDTFKKVFRKDELEDFLKDKNIKINIL